MVAASLLRTFNAADYGVRADGQTDDAGTIATAINAALAQGGGRVALPVGSTTLVRSTVTVPAGVELVVPVGATLRLGDGANTDVLAVASGAAVTGGGTIDGNRAGQTAGAGAGVALTAATDALLGDLRVRSCRGSGVLASGGGRHQLRGIVLADNGVHGASIVNSVGNVLSGVLAYDNSRISAAGTGDGVNVSGTSTDTAIAGLVAYDSAGAAGRQGYGVREAAGSTADRTTIAAAAIGAHALGAVSLVGAASGVASTAPATNLLVNGGFEVLQRGAGPYTATGAYAHDRWQILLGGTSTISVADEAAIVDAGSGHALRAAYVQGSANSQVDQKIEHYLQLRGRLVTFAVRVRKGVASSVRPYVADSGVRTYGQATATTGAYETHAVTLLVGAAATSVSVGVELSASDTVYLDNATLCVGAVALAYVPLDAALELARCQRYYQEVGGLDLNEIVGAGQAVAATSARVPVRFPVEMYAAPAVGVSAPGDWQVLDAAGGAVAATALASGLVTRRSCQLIVTVAAGLVGGNAVLLRAAATAAARVTFAANP